jgi:hypothetical protein
LRRRAALDREEAVERRAVFGVATEALDGFRRFGDDAAGAKRGGGVR